MKGRTQGPGLFVVDLGGARHHTVVTPRKSALAGRFGRGRTGDHPAQVTQHRPGAVQERGSGIRLAGAHLVARLMVLELAAQGHGPSDRLDVQVAARGVGSALGHRRGVREQSRGGTQLQPVGMQGREALGGLRPLARDLSGQHRQRAEQVHAPRSTCRERAPGHHHDPVRAEPLGEHLGSGDGRLGALPARPARVVLSQVHRSSSFRGEWRRHYAP